MATTPLRIVLASRASDAPLQPLVPRRSCAGGVDPNKLDDWLTNADACHAVVAAFSSAFFNASDGKIFALNQEQNVGHRIWWIAMLQHTEMEKRVGYGCVADQHSYATNSTDGAPDWLPGQKFAEEEMLLYEPYELATTPGLDTDIFYTDFKLADDKYAADDASIARLHALLKFAKIGAGRIIMAAFQLFDYDAYTEQLSDVWHETPPTTDHAGGTVKAIVIVRPLAVFSLVEMLKQHRGASLDAVRKLAPELAALQSTIFEATLSIARKVRAMADAGCLKLDLTCFDIIFSPKLDENPDDPEQLLETGFSFNGRKGTPFVNAGEPTFTSHGLARIHSDCSYVVMMLSLLASVRSEYGSALSVLMKRRLSGESAEGAALPPLELPDCDDAVNLRTVSARVKRSRAAPSFAGHIRSMLPSFVIGRNELYTRALLEAADDFLDIVGMGALVDGAGQGRYGFDRSVFEQLISIALASSVVTTNVFGGVSTDTTSDEQANDIEQRLLRVIEARKARMRAKMN